MLDWDDLRFVLAVARGGTLSAAARALGVAQPTVGRRIAAFEQAVGARLFQRRPSGLVPTAAGRTVLGHVERMEHEALGAARAVTGRDTGVRGSVRITASEWLVVRVLGPALAGLVDRHRGLTLDVVADPRHLNLVRREADVALRPRRFEHDAIHQRRLARVELGLYASPAYLSAHGAPDGGDGGDGGDGDVADHTVIVMQDDVGDIARAWLASVTGGARIAVRTNGREAMVTMAVAGIGLACLPRIVGDAQAGLRRLPTARPPPDRVLWLGVHRDARTIPRVRAVIDWLVDEFARLGPAFAPGR